MVKDKKNINKQKREKEKKHFCLIKLMIKFTINSSKCLSLYSKINY